MQHVPLRYPKLTIFSYLLASLLSTMLYAQNNLLKTTLPSNLGNYIELHYQQQKQKGIVRYMTFHDHDPQQLQGNPNLVAHQHQYYKPFTQATKRFEQVQLVGQYVLNKRTIIRATIPYWQKQRIEEGDFESRVTKKRAGIGDISLTGKYQLFNSSLVRINQDIEHIFWVGAGIKAPTGKDDQFDELNELEPDFEVGTGSWDFLGSIDYWGQYKKWQLQAHASYQYNGKSRYTYQFGNAIHGQLRMSYYWHWKNWVLQPHIQTTFDDKGVDKMNGRIITLEDTERTTYLGGVGGAIAFQNIKLNFQYLHPILERLAVLQSATQGRWKIGIKYIM